MKGFLTEFQRDALAVLGAAMAILPAIISIARRLGIGIAAVAAFAALVVLAPIAVTVARYLRRRKQAIGAQIHPLFRDRDAQSQKRTEESSRRAHWIKVLVISAPISLFSLLLPHFDSYLDDPSASDIAFWLIEVLSGFASVATVAAIVVLLFLTIPSLERYFSDDSAKGLLGLLAISLAGLFLFTFLGSLIADKRSATVYLLRPYLMSLALLFFVGLIGSVGAIFEAIKERRSQAR